MNDCLADHYTVFCIRKKAREHHDKKFKTVRDYSKYNREHFENLITTCDWQLYDVLIDPNVQWEILMSNVLSILSIMCPYKNIFARKEITPWLTPEIYRTIQEKRCLLRTYKQSRDPEDLMALNILRNSLNTMVERAKRNIIKNSIRRNGSIFGKRYLLAIDHIMSALFWSYVPHMK